MYELYIEKNEPESIGNYEYKPKVSYDFYFRYFKKMLITVLDLHDQTHAKDVIYYIIS